MKTTIEIDVTNDYDAGKYDVWMSNDGSSGAHYKNVTARQIGNLAADYVDCLEENESGKSYLYSTEPEPKKYYPISKPSEFFELIDQIIDIFEDFLTQKGVELMNDEKSDKDVYPESCANIYGTDYGLIQDRLEDLLMNWDICDKEVRDNER